MRNVGELSARRTSGSFSRGVVSNNSTIAAISSGTGGGVP